MRAALAFACALLFILQFRGIPRPITVVMDVRTEHCAQLHLQYDVPVNSSAPESVVRMIDSRERFRTLRIPIDSSAVRNVRLLALAGCGRLWLRHVRLELLGGRVVSVPTTDIFPISPATTLTRRSDVVKINGGEADAGVAFLVSDFVYASRFADCLSWMIVLALCGTTTALAWLLRGSTLPGSAISIHADGVIGHAFIALTVSMYMIASIANVSGSATPFWHYYADRSAPDAGVLLGTPKEIRSDEWMVHTPWMMSQAARYPPFSTENPGVGDGAMTLLNNLPARHWSMFFRPQMWGFFVADFSHAFAFYWNFKWFSLLVGAFLFLRVVCNGQSLVAIFGALLVYFSPLSSGGLAHLPACRKCSVRCF